MEASDKTARQMYEEIKAKPTRPRFGFGHKPALVNIDLQKAYTCVDEFATAYETDPKQIDYVNRMSDLLFVLARYEDRSLPLELTTGEPD